MGQTRFEVALHRVPTGDGTSAFLQVNGMQVFESGLDRAVFRILSFVSSFTCPVSFSALDTVITETPNLDAISPNLTDIVLY